MPWDVCTLKEHVEKLLAEMDHRYEDRFVASERARDAALASQEKLVDAAFSAAEKAGSKAEESATARLDQHNQLQTKMDRQAATFAEKDWVLVGRQALEREVRAGKEAVEREIRELAQRVSRFEDREEGMSLTTKIIMGAAGLLATVISIYFALK